MLRNDALAGPPIAIPPLDSGMRASFIPMELID